MRVCAVPDKALIELLPLRRRKRASVATRTSMPFPPPHMLTCVRTGYSEDDPKEKQWLSFIWSAACPHSTWAARGFRFLIICPLPDLGGWVRGVLFPTPVFHLLFTLRPGEAFLPELLSRTCSESLLSCSATDSQIPTVPWKGRAPSPVVEVRAKSGGVTAQGSARLSSAPGSAPPQDHQAPEAVNYYPLSPDQGRVRNLSHSLSLSACWECLLSFLGAADRNAPLLSDTHREK